METLRRGSFGVRVIELQNKLKALGFYQGASDGDFGVGTEAAVRRFQTQARLTADGIVGAATWSVLNASVSTSPTPTSNVAIDLNALKTNQAAIAQIQAGLRKIGFYTDRADGYFDPTTENAIHSFAYALTLDSVSRSTLDLSTAQSLLHIPEVVPFVLSYASDRSKILGKFLQQQTEMFATQQADAEHLAFLDRGVDALPKGSIPALPNRCFAASPFKPDIAYYPDRLAVKPDGVQVTSYGQEYRLAGSNTVVQFSAYPNLGVMPPRQSLDQHPSLAFLHADIRAACMCVGSFANGQFMAHWLGRNALEKAQYWSTTKFIPILNIVCRANAIAPTCELSNGKIMDMTGVKGMLSFPDLIRRMVSYENSVSDSNALAAMFKQFETPKNLENWVKQITGNPNLEFQGRYGVAPFTTKPELIDLKTRRTLLKASSELHTGNNLLSAYDLTRFISMLAWHNYLPQSARLPNAQWHSLKTVVQAMGIDTARYVDVAIASLGLSNVISSPVIISKLGFGGSSENSRDRTELAYVAAVQFVDRLALDSPSSKVPKPPRLRTLCLTLLGAKALTGSDRLAREAAELDARMAAEVTEIMRRVVTGELA